jgi:hypothetical protein
MIVTPPRLTGLQIKQQAFRHCVEQLWWNYLLKKEGVGGKDDNDKDNNNGDDKGDDDEESNDVDLINSSSTTASNKKCKFNTPLWLRHIQTNTSTRGGRRWI